MKLFSVSDSRKRFILGRSSFNSSCKMWFDSCCCFNNYCQLIVFWRLSWVRCLKCLLFGRSSTLFIFLHRDLIRQPAFVPNLFIARRIYLTIPVTNIQKLLATATKWFGQLKTEKHRLICAFVMLHQHRWGVTKWCVWLVVEHVQKCWRSPDLHRKENGRRIDFFQGWTNSGEISFYQLETKRLRFFY